MHMKTTAPMLKMLELHGYPYSGINVFVETGTFMGKTAELFAPMFRKIHTIEINEGLWLRARKRGEDLHLDNVIYHHGDSAQVLTELTESIREPVVWELDAHFCRHKSATVTERPEHGPFPLFAELATIAARPYADIVIVDDSPNFGRVRRDLRQPGTTEPQWEAVSRESIIAALGGPARVIADEDFRKSWFFWRNEVQP